MIRIRARLNGGWLEKADRESESPTHDQDNATQIPQNRLGRRRSRCGGRPFPPAPTMTITPSMTTPGGPLHRLWHAVPARGRRQAPGEAAGDFARHRDLPDPDRAARRHHITPNGLHFDRNHNGVADIDPKTHKLLIHGLVKTPLEFSVDALMRYPRVSEMHFMECGGNMLNPRRASACADHCGRDSRPLVMRRMERRETGRAAG